MTEIEIKELVKQFNGKNNGTEWSSKVYLTADGQFMAKVKIGLTDFVTPCFANFDNAAGAGFQILTEMLEVGVGQ